MGTTARDVDALALVGTVVADKYRVVSVVGEGGFATVYRADHLVWERPVALKVFRGFPRISEEERTVLFEGFLREGRVLAELSERSASIVQARDTGMLVTPSGAAFPFMVLEWLDGETLEARLARERDEGATLRTMSEAVELLDPIAHALGLAHGRGIAHRDIKPANIFVVTDPVTGQAALKLLDFGIAKVASELATGAKVFAETMSTLTTFTPTYGAPEQFSRIHGVTGPWTDVFALALTLVEVALGMEALRGETIAALGSGSCDPHRRPTPRAQGVDVSEAVEAIFTRALAVAPDARYPDAQAFWSELTAATRHETSELRAIQADSSRPTDPFLLAHEVAPKGVYEPKDDRRAGQPPSRRIGPTAAVATVIGMSIVSSSALLAPTLGRHFGDLFAQWAPAAAVRESSHASLRADDGSRPAVVASSTPVEVRPEPKCPSRMAKIPGGHFFMGSDDKDDLPVERPSHGVDLAPYCIDLYEVTTAEYKAASDVGQTKRAGRANEWDDITAKDHESLDPLCNIRDVDGHATHPINCVTWEMAKLYCESKDERLPTEAEWEFAARGPDGRRYPWGDAPPGPGLLNACGKECVAWGRSHGVAETAMFALDDGWPTTAPVGSFPEGRSRYGLYDVAGNVWEWVADRYAPYTSEEVTNPTGPSKGEDRVIRGGAFNGAYASWVRPTFRFHSNESTRSYGIGFRCAASWPPARPSPERH